MTENTSDSTVRVKFFLLRAAFFNFPARLDNAAFFGYNMSENNNRGGLSAEEESALSAPFSWRLGVVNEREKLMLDAA